MVCDWSWCPWNLAGYGPVSSRVAKVYRPTPLGVSLARDMAGYAVAACTPTPRVATRPPACRTKNGVGQSSTRGLGYVEKRHDDRSRCRPGSTSRISAGSCDLYDVSDDLTPYSVAWGWQKVILDKRLEALSAEREGEGDGARDINNPESSPDEGSHQLGERDVLLLVQHPPVVTLGTGSTPDNLKFDPDSDDAPFETYRTERGGEATYHGPGQLVMYPILDLQGRGRPDLHLYMRNLEEVAIIAMEDLGVRYAGRVEGLTGSWANVKGEGADDDLSNLSTNSNQIETETPTALSERPHKVAAIGVRARRWVTYHGMAFNVDCDLSDFAHIVPCGIGDRPVGSVAQLLDGKAGIVSSNIGSVDAAGYENPGPGSCGGGGFAVDANVGPDKELMRRAKEALLAAFQEVFELELVRRGGVPPV